MKAQDLKRSILQLAIQGKLVPQNPSDEPASELLKKIKAEKAELVKQGKIKKDKQESYIYKGSDNNYYEKIGSEIKDITDEIPFEIPENWEWVRLGNISNINGGFAFKSTKYVPNGVRVIRISDFDELGIKNKNIVRYSFSQELLPYELEKNNIILAMTGGTVGKSYLVEHLDEPMYVNQRVATIKILNPLEIKYINTVILSDITQKIIKYSKNSTNDNISMDTIKGFLFPLPPLSEQGRIVKKIEELEPFIEEYGKTEVELTALNSNFPEQIKKSILQYAIQGKLVEQDPNDEPASVLLEKIKAEKQELIKQGKIKKDKQESYIFKGADNRHYEKIGLETKDITDEIPFEIPESWEWCRLDTICNIMNGYAYKSSTYISKSNNQIIRLGNVKKGAIILQDKQIFIDDNYAQKTDIFRITDGDILVTLTGTREKRDYFYSVVYRKKENDPNLYLNQRVGLLQCNIAIIPEMLQILLNGEYLLNKIFATETGTANQGNIGTGNVQKLLIPLPPIEEQRRIILKIEQLNQYIENL